MLWPPGPGFFFTFDRYYTVERILLTYLRTLLTYRKLHFADKLWTLEEKQMPLYFTRIKFWIKKVALFFT